MPTDRATGTRSSGPHPAARRSAVPGDGGFSILEVMVAIAVIGVVMTAMTPFLAKSMVVVSNQRGEQVAIEVANDALERARALDPSSLLAGRGRQLTENQWNAAPPEVGAYLADTERASDPVLLPNSTAGAGAPLPTAPVPFILAGTTYLQNWYVGRCWQPRTDPTQAAAAVPDCTTTRTANDVPFFRIVVSVTRQHASCAPALCVDYVAATLVNVGTDPTFDINRPPPTITSPGNQLAHVGVLVNLPLAASGGWLPRKWSVPSLPAGLVLDPDTGVISGTPTTAGSSSVTVTVTGRDNKTDDVTFTWTITAPPALTSPSARTSHVGTLVTLSIARTDGQTPFTWSQTGLPTGLTINATSGEITGTPTAARADTPVTVTVTDAVGRTAAVTFGWRVLTAVQIAGLPSAYSANNNTNVGTVTPTASGGLGPYTWQALDLPNGLAINPNTGAVTGTIRSGSRYITTIIATDSRGGTGTATVVVTVVPDGNGDLRVTNPVPANPDRTTALGASVTLNAAGDPGSGGTWSVTGLPTGLTMTSGGAISGHPTVRGTYVTKLTLQRGGTNRAYLMFTWRVT